MRREGRVRGKPTNKSRVTGKCRLGQTRCRGCRDHPVEKSRPKRVGRYKRFATDVRINPSLADFCVQPSLKQRSACRHEDENTVVKVAIFVATVNSVIDAAFATMPRGYSDPWRMDETTAMACATFDLEGGAVLASDGTDTISAVEEAFHRVLGVFANAVEGSSFSETHFARKWGSVLSEESWSDVELSESGSEDDDDDWTMVDDIDV